MRTHTMCILCKQTATTCAHQYAVEEQVQLHDVILRRSKVTATLNCALTPFVCEFTLALR